MTAVAEKPSSASRAEAQTEFDSLPVTFLVAKPSKYRVLDEPTPITAEIDTLDGGSGDSDTV